MADENLFGSNDEEDPVTDVTITIDRAGIANEEPQQEKFSNPAVPFNATDPRAAMADPRVSAIADSVAAAAAAAHSINPVSNPHSQAPPTAMPGSAVNQALGLPMDPNLHAAVSNPDQLIEEIGQVSALYVGRVIGKGGEMIRDLQARLSHA